MIKTTSVFIQKQKNAVFFILFFLLTNSVFSQSYTLKGKVYDADSKEPLIGASILVLCSASSGTMCDDNGNYTVQIKSKECEIRFQYVGYEAVTKTVSFQNTNTIVLDIPMQNKNVLNKVNIKAKRDEIKKEELVSSVEVINSQYITDFNITTLDNAFKQTSGLVIVDSEPQMRGGSGFSSGLGSRVMVMMDEMPVMRADAGRPAWNLIPMENVEQIEILKGAASVLYGSAATTGAINVRTTYPKGKPQTKITLYNGFYSRPKEDYRCSWEKGVTPLTYGASISHTRKIKKFDLILSMEYAHDDGFVNMDTATTAQGYLPVRERRTPEEYKAFMNDSSSFRFGDSSYHKLIKEERLRFNFGTRYRFTENTSAGLNGIILYSKNTMTHFWANADNGIYNVYPGALSQMTDFICLLDPYFKYFGKNESSHSVKGRFMFSDNGADNVNQDCRSEMYYLEYQYAKRFKKLDMQLFAGLAEQFVRSYGKLFSGLYTITPETKVLPKYSTNTALYAQLEKKFLKKKNLTVLAGGRLEYSQIFKHGDLRQNDSNGNYVDLMPVFRAGINYKMERTQTSLRASFGQGYRFPTIGERYLMMRIGSSGFYFNSDLKAETSWNVEVGVNQLYKLLNIEGYFDIAAYYQRYNNYIEFFMGPWLPPEEEKSEFKRYGFRFFNTGPARIIGVDLSLAGQNQVNSFLKYTFFFAYSYTNPKVLDPDFIYTKTSTKEYNYYNTSTDTTGRIMKYRLEHVIKADLDFTFFDMLSVGASAQYYSQMKNIDKTFYNMDRFHPDAEEAIAGTKGIFPYDGLYDYRQMNDKGTWVLGLRAGVEYANVKLAVIVHNLLNKEYSLRPMAAEAPRLTTLQLTYKFTEGEPFFPKKKKESAQTSNL